MGSQGGRSCFADYLCSHKTHNNLRNEATSGKNHGIPVKKCWEIGEGKPQPRVALHLIRKNESVSRPFEHPPKTGSKTRLYFLAVEAPNYCPNRVIKTRLFIF